MSGDFFNIKQGSNEICSQLYLHTRYMQFKTRKMCCILLERVETREIKQKITINIHLPFYIAMKRSTFACRKCIRILSRSETLGYRITTQINNCSNISVFPSKKRHRKRAELGPFCASEHCGTVSGPDGQIRAGGSAAPNQSAWAIPF